MLGVSYVLTGVAVLPGVNDSGLFERLFKQATLWDSWQLFRSKEPPLTGEDKEGPAVNQRIGARLFLSIALLVGAFGCARTPEAKRDRFVRAGKQFLEKKQYSRAVLEFKNAVAAMPRDPEAVYQLGLAYAAVNEMQGAWNSFRTALQLNPNHAGARLQTAMILASTPNANQWKEAEAYLADVLEQSPSDAAALNVMAITELKLGKTASAEQRLQRSLEAAPHLLQSSVLLARSRIAQQDYAGAEKALQDACRNNPTSSDAAVLLGEFYVAANRMSEAGQQFENAVALHPEYAPALLRLGKHQAVIGQKEQADQTFRKLATLPHAETRSVHAIYLFEAGRREEAIAELEQLTKADPSDALTRTRLVTAYRAVGRTADAEAVLNQALKRNGADFTALLHRAELFLATGQAGRAQTDLYRAVQSKPNSPEAHHLMARLHRKNGSTEIERQELFEVLRLNPGLLGARLELANSFLAGKAPQTALDILHQAPALQQNLLPLQVQRGWAYWALGNMTEVKKLLSSGVARRIPDLLILQGLVHLKEGRYSEARESLEQAVQTNPEDLRAIDVLRRSYLSQGQKANAMQRVEEYAASHPQSAPVQAFLGSARRGNDDPAKARAAFEAALATDPAFEPALFALMEMEITEKQWAKAKTRLQAILAGNAYNLRALTWLANVEELLGNRAEAIRLYQKVVEADPNMPEALNNLAYLLAQQGNRIDEALKYAQKAQELAPENPNYADTLGWVLYQKGLYRLAMKNLERATTLPGNSPLSQYHLAMVYAKVGDVKRGRGLLQTALARDSSLPEAKIAAGLLKEAGVAR